MSENLLQAQDRPGNQEPGRTIEFKDEAGRLITTIEIPAARSLAPGDSDVLKSQPIGDMKWLMTETGWTHDKISRLCRLRQIRGAFQSQPGTRGSMWHFRKAKTLAWLEGLEVK
jgi:hypothetical protein